MATLEDADNVYYRLVTEPMNHDDQSVSWETLQHVGTSPESPPLSRQGPADWRRLEAPEIPEQELSHAALALLAATHGQNYDARPRNDEIMSCSTTESEGTVRLAQSDASMTLASADEDDRDDRSSVTEAAEMDTIYRRNDCGDDPLAAKEALRQEVDTFIRDSDSPSSGFSAGDDISCLVMEPLDPSVLEEWLVKAGLPSTLSDSIRSRLSELQLLHLPEADLRKRIRAVLIDAGRAAEVDKIRTDLIEPPKLEPVGFSGAERFVKRKWCCTVQG